MYVVIAEDEVKNALSIKRILEKKVKGIKAIVCQAENEKIIEKIIDIEPAVAILSVNLKGLNGLEIARRLHAIGCETRIILISSYTRFEFLKEAIRVNVQDYLLKPLIESQLILAVTEAIEVHEKQKEVQEIIANKEKEVEEARRHIEYSLMYSALFNGEASEEIRNYKKLFSLGETGYIINIEIDSFDSDSLVDLKKDEVQINNFLRRIVSEHNKCIIGPRMLNRILVWVDSSEKGRKVPESPMADIKLSAHIIIALKDRFLINVSIGVGGEKTIFNLHASYEEAVRCLRYKGVHNVVRIRDVEQKEISPTEYNELENRLLKSIKFGKAEIINLFVELLDQMRCLEENVYRNKIYEVLVLAAHESRLAGQNSLDYIDFKLYFENKWDLPLDHLERWAYQRFEYLINSVQTSRLEIRSDAVNSAIRYMEEHYMEEITLEEIARYIGISPQHFSKIFKGEMKINYIEWLTELRLDIAKRLLAEGGKTVKEVCYVVGYNDPNYFSRIFKKTIGISPTEYAKGMRPNAYQQDQVIPNSSN